MYCVSSTYLTILLASLFPTTTWLGPPATANDAVPKSAQATEIEIGKQIFFDKQFSANQTISCADCHQPDKAFSDGKRVAVGVNNQAGTRNTPSLLVTGFSRSLFWDGRRHTLEQLVLDPFVNPVEHGLNNHDELIAKVRRDHSYQEKFSDVYGVKPSDIGTEHIARSLAAFVRALAAGTAPFDQYYFNRENKALSPAAARGFELFKGRARCTGCHTIEAHDAKFTDDKFHNRGIGLNIIKNRLPELTARVARQPHSQIDMTLRDSELAELGRFLVSRDPRDIGKFKTPSLRNVAKTAPYMHNGSVATLEEAVEKELYYQGLETNRPVILTPTEKAYLVEFLKALSDETIPHALIADRASERPRMSSRY